MLTALVIWLGCGALAAHRLHAKEGPPLNGWRSYASALVLGPIALVAALLR
jgi:hypothetical protein